MTEMTRLPATILILCVFTLIPASIFAAQDLPPEVLSYADMVFVNGSVLTMDQDRPPIKVVEAVAVRDSRILAVGDNNRILSMAGPATL